jgi:hypothetical protein
MLFVFSAFNASASACVIPGCATMGGKTGIWGWAITVKFGSGGSMPFEPA